MIRILKLNQIRQGDIVHGLTDNFEIILKVVYKDDEYCGIYISQEETYCNYIIDYTCLEKDETRFYRLEKDIINQLPSKSKVKNLLKLIEYKGN